jgi:hypothetical protein
MFMLGHCLICVGRGILDGSLPTSGIVISCPLCCSILSITNDILSFCHTIFFFSLFNSHFSLFATSSFATSTAGSAARQT